MGFLKETSKSLLIAMSCAICFFIAGASFDKKINSNRFMDYGTIYLQSRLDDVVMRNMASYTKGNDTIILKYNAGSRGLVDGVWKIANVFDEESSNRILRKKNEAGELIIGAETGLPIIEILESSSRSDSMINENMQENDVQVHFELIGDDLIKININGQMDDNAQDDWVVYSLGKNKMVLMKWLRDGYYEVIEAQRALKTMGHQPVAMSEKSYLRKKNTAHNGGSEKILAPESKNATKNCIKRTDDLVVLEVSGHRGSKEKIYANDDKDNGKTLEGSVQVYFEDGEEKVNNFEVVINNKDRISISEMNVNSCIFHAGNEEDDGESYTGLISPQGTGYKFSFTGSPNNKALKNMTIVFVAESELDRINSEKSERAMLSTLNGDDYRKNDSEALEAETIEANNEALNTTFDRDDSSRSSGLIVARGKTRHSQYYGPGDETDEEYEESEFLPEDDEDGGEAMENSIANPKREDEDLDF